MAIHDKRLQAMTASYLAFNAAVSGASGGMKQFITNNNTVNNTLNTTNNVTRNVANSVQNMGNAANRAGGQFDGMLGTMLKYRAVSAVFEGVQRSVGAAVTAMYDMERQAARVQRVSGPGATPGIRADIAVEAARTGADVKDIGEAYYQLKTQIKDNATAFAALNTAMNLHIGLEADARDTTRAMLQIYNQFGDQLGANVDQSEKLRRAGELLAVMWKGSDAEVSDLIASLKYLGPIAQAAHVPLEQVAATISALTHEGVRGRMGGTEAGQLLGQIIKNYNAATGMIENKGATLQAALTPQGGIDLLGTMRNFNEVASHMPVETAMKFSQAISGTMNAWRLFGSVNPEFLRVLQEKMDDATKATHGLSTETDDLRKTMGTTAQEWNRVWKGMFSTIANLIDLSPIRGWLHGIADDLKRLAQWRRDEQEDERSTAAALAPGANVRNAVTVLRNAVKLSLEADDIGGPSVGIPMEGLTRTERAELIRRYGAGSNSLGDPDRLDATKMRRDLATMDAQLANPRFGLSPTPVVVSPPSGTGSGLKGLTRQQAENAAIIAEVARKHGIDPNAMIAAAYAESNLNARDVNPTSGATGLFQFLRSTRPDINRADPRANAEAAAHEITTAMSGHGAIPQGLTGIEAARWIIEKFERPGPAGVRGDMSRVAEFYRKHVGGDVKGGYVDEEAQKEAERAAEEARKKKIEDAKEMVEHAKDLYDLAVKTYGLESKQAREAGLTHDQLALMLTRTEQSPLETFRLKHGLSGIMPERQEKIAEAERKRREDAKKEREETDRDWAESLKERAAATEYYAEQARTQHGAFSPIARQQAMVAQAAAEAAATESATDLKKIRDYETGPWKQHIDAVREATDAIRERAKAAYDAVEAEKEFGRSVREGFARRDMTDYERRAQTRQYGLRPNLLGSGLDARQESALVANIADLQSTKKSMARNATEEQLQSMRDKLEAANAALTDFHDSLEAKAHQRQIQAQEDAFELSTQRIGRLHGLRFNKDEASAFADEMQKLSELLAAEQAHVRQVAATAGLDPDDSRLRDARKREQAARERMEDYPVEYANRRYAETYSRVRDDVRGAFMDFFHGQGDLGTVAQRVGGGIVDAALDAQIKRFTDPLITTVTQEILALENLTDAVSVLNGTIGGGGSVYGNGPTTSGGLAGAVAAGVQAGFEDVGGGIVGGAASGAQAGAQKGGAYKQSDLQKGVVAGLSAYSIGAQSASQGTNLGNLLGSAVSGFAIGGPIGAGVGVVANLIGGLFHHKDKPKEQPRDLNPAYYNAPAAFDVAAYNYSAYGKLPRVQDVGFDVQPRNVPVVNVYVDGAKVAARQEITRQTILANVSLTSPAIDRHTPV